ncbi:uncharacterized protein EI90DRAFT_1302641 [Cantharellus anzutake]|uniref:uncharacterized protein n=1 Tax=Cantharellus anzutake TaxID=1750568 RepID=UPI001905A255|nr:uncharacterized protein EI90DRAFT_1302641 [Cantharellus anzutake]KAF8342111.1 hypothetical protein EI90DRAFT_1302641 [Cantharellus anzutake]
MNSLFSCLAVEVLVFGVDECYGFEIGGVSPSYSIVSGRANGVVRVFDKFCHRPGNHACIQVSRSYQASQPINPPYQGVFFTLQIGPKRPISMWTSWDVLVMRLVAKNGLWENMRMS